MRGVVKDLSSNEYHSLKDSYSSSQLKTMLEDPEIFYRKYVIKEIEKEEIPAFDVGTYFHTAILEPHKLKDECAVYSGIRRGKEWESFKETHKGKAIITEAEMGSAQSLISAVKNSKISQDLLSKGMPEVSCFIDVFVYSGEVFSQGNVLTRDGWLPSLVFHLAEDFGVKICLKVRADLLGNDFILDLKSTTGNAKNEHSIKQKVSMYSYDLSAALYLDVFSIGLNSPIPSFIWTFASKDYGNCKNYLASLDNIRIGRRKWRKAVMLLAEYISNNWTFADSLSVIEPAFFEREHLLEESKEILDL